METRDNLYIDVNQDLIDGCRRFDQKSQFQIYKLYYKAMYNISLRIVKDPMEAEDIMQESFLSAFEKIETFSGTVSFGSWLKKIVENRSLDFLRKSRPVFVEISDKLNCCFTDDDDSVQADKTIMIEKIRDVIETLPSGYRTVLTLNLFEGFDHEEIGKILGIATITSRSQYSRAREKLVEKLKAARISFT